MAHKSDADWEKWGQQDPYFGVLTHDKFRNVSIEDNWEEFFSIGQELVDIVLARYSTCFGPLKTGRALDFGCGVGRLTLALADRFDEVRGIDISPSMLAEAEKNARAEAKADRVTFGLSDDELSQAAGQYDLVFSFIVLQHIPVDRGMAVIRRLIGRVRPGGAFFLHFSTWPRPTLVNRVAAQLKSSPVRMGLYNLARGQSFGQPTMLMENYPLGTVLKLLHDAGVGDVVTIPDNHGDVFTIGLLGRKPA